MRAPAAFVATAGLVSIAACTARGGDAFEREASRIERALTAASGTQLLERSTGQRNGLQVTHTWRLRAAGDWAPYAQGLEGAVSGSYRCSREGTALHCSRSMPGDVLRLRVASEAAAADGLVIRAELLGTPD